MAANVIRATTLSILIALSPTAGLAQSAQGDSIQSTITGLRLPVAAKRAGAFARMAATVLLQDQADKFGVEVDNAEAFYLPLSASGDPQGRATFDTLTARLRVLRWAIRTTDVPKDYFILERDSTWVLGYFAATKKDLQLYLGQGDRGAVAVTPTTPSAAQPPQASQTPIPAPSPAGPPAGQPGGATTESSALIGDWSTSSISLANFVSPSGAYSGDASIQTSEEWNLRGDATYTYTFIGMRSGRTYYTQTTGTYAVDGDNVTFTPKQRRGGYLPQIADEASMLGAPKTYKWFVGPDRYDHVTALHLHHDSDYYMYSDFPWTAFKMVQPRER